MGLTLKFEINTHPRKPIMTRVASPNGLKIFSGTANTDLAKSICKFLKVPLGDLMVSRFSEGEIRIKINEDVRGRDILLFSLPARR
jgi:phosphoribosylpyrophosphate synthetase